MTSKPEEMLATMKTNLKLKTGKTLSQWVKIGRTAKLDKHGQLLKLFKTEHGVTHGYANLIAHEVLATGQSTDLVAAQYPKAKAKLKPIYAALIKLVHDLGKDVEIAPKKTYVSLRRHKQFAIVQPTTRTRVDLGLNLKGTKPTARLEKSGSFNGMVSHRVRLSQVEDVDGAIKQWLKQAYDLA